MVLYQRCFVQFLETVLIDMNMRLKGILALSIGGKKFIRRIIYSLERQTDNSIMRTLRRVQAPRIRDGQHGRGSEKRNQGSHGRSRISSEDVVVSEQGTLIPRQGAGERVGSRVGPPVLTVMYTHIHRRETWHLEIC